MSTDQYQDPNNQMPFIMTDCNESSSLSLTSSISLKESNSTMNSGSVSSENNSFHTPMKSVDNSNVFHDAIAAEVKTTDSKSPTKKLPNSSTSTPAKIIPNILTPANNSMVKNQNEAALISHDLKEVDDFLGPLGFSDNEDDTSDELLYKSKVASEPLLPPPLPSESTASNNVLTNSISRENLTNSTIKKQTRAISHELKEIDAVFGPLGFSDDDDDDENDSEFSFKSKKIAQNSSNNKENKNTIGGVRRQSTIAKVRRSSRFLTPLNTKNNSNNESALGSIITEVEIKDRRKSRRSNLFIRPKLELIEKSSRSSSGTSSPTLNEETMKLIKNNDKSLTLDSVDDCIEDVCHQQKRLKSFE